MQFFFSNFEIREILTTNSGVTDLKDRNHDILNGTLTEFTNVLPPYSTGLYEFVTSGVGLTLNNIDIAATEWDWTLIIDTEAITSVPEPTTLALLSLGLIGLRFNKRKRL